MTQDNTENKQAEPSFEKKELFAEPKKVYSKESSQTDQDSAPISRSEEAPRRRRVRISQSVGRQSDYQRASTRHSEGYRSYPSSETGRFRGGRYHDPANRRFSYPNDNNYRNEYESQSDYREQARRNERRSYYQEKYNRAHESSLEQYGRSREYRPADNREEATVCEGGFHRPRAYVPQQGLRGRQPYAPPRLRPQQDAGAPGTYRPTLKNSKRGVRKGKPGQTFTPRPKPVVYEPEVEKLSGPIRLNKYLANSGVCSRREADDLIEAGNVTVNGVMVTELGVKISYQDEVAVNGKAVKPENKVYVLLNKPRNCVTTSDDPQERLTVLHLVKNACRERIYPVGRLDRNTTGVLLLTNDGDMASKLMHPSYKKKKIYHVVLDKEVAVEHMQQIADGLDLEDGEIHADAISYASDDDHAQVGIEIHSGRNRIVRRIFEHLGYKVLRLDRVYFAGLTKKGLGRSKWRYLTQDEVNMLRMGAFE